jgi:hypothetical protein
LKKNELNKYCDWVYFENGAETPFWGKEKNA